MTALRESSTEIRFLWFVIIARQTRPKKKEKSRPRISYYHTYVVHTYHDTYVVYCVPMYNSRQGKLRFEMKLVAEGKITRF